MAQVQTLPTSVTTGQQQTFATARERRVVVVLAIVAVLSLFDLAFTLTELPRAMFVELNPIAARLTTLHPHGLILYKLALFGIGGGLLLSYRQYRVAECATWVVLVAYISLGFRWWVYYGHLVASMADPAVTMDPTHAWHALHGF